MTDKMKLLIGYDGSACAEAALQDLQRAGLPAEAEVQLMTVADVFLPPPVNEEVENTFPMYVPAGIRRAHEHAAQEIAKAQDLADTAKTRLAHAFPGWRLTSEGCADSPAWALIKRADHWKPDLIVVGSHGHTAMGGRLILGSVSQRVLYEARCSVRVARGPAVVNNRPVRVVVGIDGSVDSKAALEAIAARSWPSGTEIRLLAALDTVFSVRPASQDQLVDKWFEVSNEHDLVSLRQIFEPSADRLRRLGLVVSIELKNGDPKHLLVEEAESWQADSIFVGARGMRGIDRLLLGSVSAAVAARAHCSVEVVRQQQTRE